MGRGEKYGFAPSQCHLCESERRRWCLNLNPAFRFDIPYRDPLHIDIAVKTFLAICYYGDFIYIFGLLIFLMPSSSLRFTFIRNRIHPSTQMSIASLLPSIYLPPFFFIYFALNKKADNSSPEKNNVSRTDGKANDMSDLQPQRKAAQNSSHQNSTVMKRHQGPLCKPSFRA